MSGADRTRSPRRRRRKKVYVTNFLEDTVAVVDVDPTSPTHEPRRPPHRGAQGAMKRLAILVLWLDRGVQRHDADRRPISSTSIAPSTSRSRATAACASPTAAAGRRRAAGHDERAADRVVRHALASRPTRPVDAHRAARPGGSHRDRRRSGPRRRSTYAFILQIERRAPSRSRRGRPSRRPRSSAARSTCIDADPLTPGQNGISVGEEPVAIATDDSGCNEVIANAGSCDMSDRSTSTRRAR